MIVSDRKILEYLPGSVRYDDDDESLFIARRSPGSLFATGHNFAFVTHGNGGIRSPILCS